MDLIKDLTITTCIYYDLFGTEFGGRHGPQNKYFYGLLSMMKMNCPIVLYCWHRDIPIIQDFIDKETNNSRKEQIEFREFDLYKSPLYETIKSVKDIEKQKMSDRSFDVSISKFLMLKNTILNNTRDSKYFYFLDAGLSSSSLFPNKYLTEKNHPSRRWSECSLFTEKLTHSLMKLVEPDNMVLWRIAEWTNYIDSKHCSNQDRISIIAGIFGGKQNKLLEYIDLVINKFVSIISEDKLLYLEEPIMTILYKQNPSLFKTVNFDVWYHEDSGDVFQPMRAGKKSFYHIFEELNQ
jgi:hypothetical protein